MSTKKSFPKDILPDFGYSGFQGIHLEYEYYGEWKLFQPFYFDDMLDKEVNYYLRSLDDIEEYEILGKVRLSHCSDVLIRASKDQLRVRVLDRK